MFLSSRNILENPEAGEQTRRNEKREDEKQMANRSRKGQGNWRGEGIWTQKKENQMYGSLVANTIKYTRFLPKNQVLAP
jgi:hypothetical protein